MPADLQTPPAQVAAVQENAPSFDQQYEQARGFANAGQHELALKLYSGLLARSPGNVDVLLGRGIVYTRMQRWQEAESDLRAAATAAPNYADVWSALSNMYRWSDQPAKASEAYERLVALRPEERQPIEPVVLAVQSRIANPEAAAPAGYSWAASLSGSWTDPARFDERWHDQTFAVRHYGEHGSLAFETLRAHRFDRHDYAWALDGYVDLWKGSYANVRYQHSATARLFPGNSGRVEVFQSLGGGWEASLSDDVLNFAGRVNIYGASIAKYIGNFYVLLRHQAIISDDSHSNGQRALVRYYYRGDADSYVEVAGSRGRSDDPLSLIGGQTRSGGGSISVVHYFTPQWGLKLGANKSRQTGQGSERGVSASLYRRW